MIQTGMLLAGETDGYSPRLRLDVHRDAFVYRLSSRYGIALPDAMTAQPISMGDLREFISRVGSQVGANALSPWESYRLYQLKRFIRNRRSVLRWRDSDTDRSFNVHFSALGAVKPRVRSSSDVAVQGLLRPGLTGHLGDFSYWSSVDVWTDYLSDSLFNASNYEPYNGIPYNLYGRESSSHFRSSDMLRGGIALDRNWLSVEAAIDYLRQGPTVFYPLTFSGHAPPITYLRAHADLGPVRYSHTVGELKYQRKKRKFLYSHRLQAWAWDKRLGFGLSEVIINGSTADIDTLDTLNLPRRFYWGEERDWELAYFVPFVPFKFVEHYLGDRDNGALSFDAFLLWPRGWRWYMEIFLDDISAPWTILSDDWGNKWALTTGAQFFGDMFGRDLTVTAEYSRIEPWVYTHFYGGSHRFSHFDQSLGSPNGPNSDALLVDLSIQFHERNAAGLRLGFSRKNAEARGGSIDHIFQDSGSVFDQRVVRSPSPDSEHKTFLGEGTTRSTRLGLTWTYAPLGLVRLDALAEYEFSSEAPGLYASFKGSVVLF